MIDLHCHVLPGIDDGPPTLEDSVAIARASAAAGVRTIVATPHVSWDYPNDAETIARLVDEVNERLAQEQVALTVQRGAELAFTRIADIPESELGELGLGGGGWLLVEPPFTPSVTGLENVIAGLRARGHEVVLAHPERCPAFHRDRDALVRLSASGVACSITAGSLSGRFGREVRRFALSLAEAGLVHNVASDAHDAVRRPPGLATEIDEAGLGGLRAWATETVPQAILAGQPLPPRPPEAQIAPPRRRSRWLRRR